MRSLSEMFNVNYFLVSQTDPTLSPCSISRSASTASWATSWRPSGSTGPRADATLPASMPSCIRTGPGICWPGVQLLHTTVCPDLAGAASLIQICHASCRALQSISCASITTFARLSMTMSPVLAQVSAADVCLPSAALAQGFSARPGRAMSPWSCHPPTCSSRRASPTPPTRTCWTPASRWLPVSALNLYMAGCSRGWLHHRARCKPCQGLKSMSEILQSGWLACGSLPVQWQVTVTDASSGLAQRPHSLINGPGAIASACCAHE